MLTNVYKVEVKIQFKDKIVFLDPVDQLRPVDLATLVCDLYAWPKNDQKGEAEIIIQNYLQGLMDKNLITGFAIHRARKVNQ